MQLDKIKEAYDSFLEGKISKLNKKQKVGILLASIIVPSILFGMFVIKPKIDDIKKLKKDITYLEGEIKKVEARANELDKYKQEKENVALQLKAASLLLPQQKEIPRLLTNISDLGSNSGLEFINFQPGSESPTEFYAVIPVNITVKGSYHKIGTFLDRVSKLNRIVSVTDISLGSPQKSGNLMQLNSQLKLVTYRFLEEAVEKKQQTPAKKGRGRG